MIMSQYAVGVPVVAMSMAGILSLVSAVVVPSPGIDIHSLTFTNDPAPAIVQDRTVTASNKIVAIWEASISAGGVRVCEGGGSWRYSAGHASPAIPIDDWVGEAGCWSKLPEGVTLQACATYEWGDGKSTAACSLGFRKQKE